MCDVCSILKIKSPKEIQKEELIHQRTLNSFFSEHTVQIKLCSEHERIFFLKGERGFLRVYPSLADAIRRGVFAKRVKDN